MSQVGLPKQDLVLNGAVSLDADPRVVRGVAKIGHPSMGLFLHDDDAVLVGGRSAVEP